MIRRIAIAATTAALALGGIAVAAGPAAAAPKPTITATGNVNCAITGKVKINPPLTNASTTPSTTTAKIKGTCTGSVESGVSPTGIKAVVTSVGTEPGTCSGLITPGDTPFTANVTWKASGGKINPTTVVFPGVTPVFTPAIGFALNDGDVTLGSYAGSNNADATAYLDAPPDLSVCEPTTTPSGKVKPAKGIKKLTIASGNIVIT